MEGIAMIPANSSFVTRVNTAKLVLTQCIPERTIWRQDVHSCIPERTIWRQDVHSCIKERTSCLQDSFSLYFFCKIPLCVYNK